MHIRCYFRSDSNVRHMKASEFFLHTIWSLDGACMLPFSKACFQSLNPFIVKSQIRWCMMSNELSAVKHCGVLPVAYNCCLVCKLTPCTTFTVFLPSNWKITQHCLFIHSELFLGLKCEIYKKYSPWGGGGEVRVPASYVSDRCLLHTLLESSSSWKRVDSFRVMALLLEKHFAMFNHFFFFLHPKSISLSLTRKDCNLS